MEAVTGNADGKTPAQSELEWLIAVYKREFGKDWLRVFSETISIELSGSHQNL
jgi:hypothetical protein